MAGVAYNPNDPTQQQFLSALALGESGGFGSPETVGFGGTNLSGYPTDQYGFPQWGGVGNTHAAGIFQFQPGTWDPVAAEHGLNFQNPSDQAAGAWYVAQQADPSLYQDLQSGNFQKVQSALSSIWPSVLGSASNPTGLAGALGSGAGSPVPGPSTGAPAASSDSQPTGIFGTIENWLLRGGLLLVGAVIIMVAGYILLKDKGIV